MDVKLPPIETVILGPVDLENISIWIPAAKKGPVINRACQPKKCIYSSRLPTDVNHTRGENCPEDAARILAEYTAVYHEKSLPLTIFNGWQWEYSYNLCQFDSLEYELPERGGCWETSLEAILILSVGSIDIRYIDISACGDFVYKHLDEKGKSDIEVRTFSTVRTRDGYPKKIRL